MKKITSLFLCLLASYAFAQPTSAPPTPTEDAGDVISLFSDAYTPTQTLALANFTPAGNTATVINAAGNDVYELVITGGEFHGFNLSGAIDLSAMENLHYDIWIEGTTAVGAIFNTTVSYHAGGHLTGQTTGYVDTNAIAQGQEGMWLSFDVPFSDFAPDMSMNPRDIISQIVFTHTNLSDTGPLYVDNIYFWREPFDPNNDATLSDLTLDGMTINGFSPNTFTYDVSLPNGTASPPTVAGVATQAGMGSSNVSVTQASGIPGTATVDVTAPDGITMQTYTVNFTELIQAAPDPTQASSAVVSIISNNYTDEGINFIETFGSSTEQYDLNTDGNTDTISFLGGNGGQFNYFGSPVFNIDISSAGSMHVDFYAENLDAGDDIRIVLVQDGGPIQEVIIAIDETNPGAWQSFDIGLVGGDSQTLNFTGADVSGFTDIGGIQIFPAERSSTLGSELLYLSNIYFFGGTLYTADFELAGF